MPISVDVIRGKKLFAALSYRIKTSFMNLICITRKNSSFQKPNSVVSSIPTAGTIISGYNFIPQHSYVYRIELDYSSLLAEP